MATNVTREAQASLIELHRTATRALDNWFVRQGAHTLCSGELAGFNRRAYTHGWRTRLPTNSEPIPITVLVDGRFPWRAPDVYADPDLYRVVPHVEYDGFVCALPNSAAVDSRNGVAVARFVLRQVHHLLTREWTDEERRAEFAVEFLSYWRRSVDRLLVRSLCDPGGEARSVVIWRGESYVLAAETEEQAVRWLRHRRGSDNSSREPDRFEEGLFLPLRHAPVPAEFPTTAAAMLVLAKREGEATKRALQSAVADRTKSLVVVCAAATPNGPGFFTTELLPPRKEFRGPGRSVDVKTKGFRPNNVPHHIGAMKALGNAQCVPGEVERFDPRWVHGRDTVRAVPTLHAARVIVLGCGSVGSTVAMYLARCGVGSVTLVDPELFEPANAGRHELGLASVGRHKATELASVLLDRFPHMAEAKGIARSWEDAYAADQTLFAGASLIVSAMGDWRSEGPLNFQWLSSNERPPIVYGWTEPFAAAGHAVIIGSGSGCFACGLDPHGVPQLKVTNWPSDTLRQEPACASMFQPYGPIELGHVNALVARAALDALSGTVDLNARHRIWCAPKAHVDANGGDWTAEWTMLAANQTAGGFLLHRDWRASQECPACGGRGS